MCVSMSGWYVGGWVYMCLGEHEWVSTCVDECMCEWVLECMCEWMSGWLHEWISV